MFCDEIGLESDIYTVDEVIAILSDKPKTYSIDDVIKILNVASCKKDCQVVYIVSNFIHVYVYEKGYFEIRIDAKNIELISKYITRIEYCDENAVKLFSSPRLEVLSFCQLEIYEYFSDGVCVLFGNKFDPSVLDQIPSMMRLEITQTILPKYIPAIIAMLPKWPTLSVILIANWHLEKKEYDLLRSFVRSHGVITNYTGLYSESVESHKLRRSPIWTILSFDKLPTELLRELIQMIGLGV